MTRMVEVDPDTANGFAYGRESLELLEQRGFPDYKIERAERTGASWVYTISGVQAVAPAVQASLLDLGPVRCMHGASLDYRSVNRLPHDGWQELIDCWSCHRGEFNSMTSLEIKPRARGILTSNFYLIADRDILPPCCGQSAKMFYNDLVTSNSVRALLYLFFDEYFQSRSALIIGRNGTNYEVKHFYKCLLMGETVCRAIKIGIRITDKASNTAEFMNDFYADRVLAEAADTATNTRALGYDLAFIRQA